MKVIKFVLVLLLFYVFYYAKIDEKKTLFIFRTADYAIHSISDEKRKKNTRCNSFDEATQFLEDIEINEVQNWNPIGPFSLSFYPHSVCRLVFPFCVEHEKMYANFIAVQIVEHAHTYTFEICYTEVCTSVAKPTLYYTPSIPIFAKHVFDVHAEIGETETNTRFTAYWIMAITTK